MTTNVNETIAEAARLMGLHRSDRKTAACRRNWKKALKAIKAKALKKNKRKKLCLKK